jgi:hypothetical protein
MNKTVLRVGLLLLVTRPVLGSLGIDATASGDQSGAKSTVSTEAFSTASTSELLLAFVSTDYRSGANTTVTGVSGAGLTWALVVRTNVQSGTAELWRAFAATILSGVSVTATLSQQVAASITVMSFTGVDTSGTNGSGAIGAVGSGNANPGAPTTSLTTTRNNSWVVGVGNDWDTATPRTLASGQTMVHQYLASVGDTYWVQRLTNPTPTSGTSVTINDTGPTGDRYNLSICEVLPAASIGQTWSISGTISPSPAGTGTLVTLSGASSATATADASGNYTFTGLANGNYTITPSKSGYTFGPASQTVTINGANATGVNFTATVVPAWSISGTVSPGTSGGGTLLTLSGSPSATTTANSSGNYSFGNLSNGTYTVTPSKTGFTFSPASQTVTINGANAANVNFAVILYPDLSDIIPSSAISVVQTSSGKQLQYTHDTFNGGPGPLVIQPAYNPASGTYQGTQYIYTLDSSGNWSITQQIPVAGAFVFDPAHGHFHFPFTTYGLYTVAANGGPGSPIATSGKISFCINDSFIYDPSLPNAGAIGNLGSCSDPTSLRGLDIGAVDEYDQTDEGQAINIDGVADGTYWLRAIVDPDNYLAEANKANNETDVEVTISGTNLTVLQTVTPSLASPPSISVTAPLGGATVSGTVQFAASTANTSGVQFLIDGQPLGSIVSTPPYTISWDTTTVPNGIHWLAAQTTGPTGVIGTSAVVAVTVSNFSTAPPTVQLTSPPAGSTVDATVTVSATAAGSESIASVTFYVDNSLIGTVTAPPYMIFWDTETVTAGQHSLTASATDVTGNVGTSAPVSVTVDNSHPANQIGEEVVVSVDGNGTMTTPSFTTSTDGELLVAFVAYDGPSGSPQTATVSGGGLTWTLLKRSNSQSGTAEIWAATAPDAPFTATAISQPGSGGNYHGSLTVIAFTNASGPGIVGQASAPSGAPDIYLPGVSAGNWVFAVGNDWDNAIGRTPVSGQVLVHQRVDTQVNDTYWVQSTAVPSSVNGLVDIHDSAPTKDQWNYAAAEIVATRQ